VERRAKIVATLGPATYDETIIRQLIQTGMNVARINFSHGDHEIHANAIKLIRKAAAELDQSVTILQDLQGPKIRTGEIADGQVELVAGQNLTLVVDPVIGDHQRISVDYSGLPKCVQHCS
jgi:pyruvate kinase